MRTATVHELKKELQNLSANELVELCLSLTKYKKDNKEFLTYLLFDAHNKQQFTDDVKQEIDKQFSELNPQINLYYAKKSLRKILRLIGRYTKYLNDKAISAELHIYFCNKLKNSGIPFQKSEQLIKLYNNQLKK